MKRYALICGWVWIIVCAVRAPGVHAQENIVIQCGAVVSAAFDVPDDEVEYFIDLNAGDVVNAQGASPNAQFVLQFHAPDNTRLIESAPLSSSPVLTTPAAPAAGRYNLEADNNKDGVSGGMGAFTIQVSCTRAQTAAGGEGRVVQCGEIVAGTFDVEDDEVEYFIDLQQGDVVIAAGSAGSAQFVLQFHAPDNTRLIESAPLSQTPTLTTPAAPAAGRYNLEADNNKDGVSGGTGEFRVSVVCLVRNRTVRIAPYSGTTVIFAGGGFGGGGGQASLYVPDLGDAQNATAAPNSQLSGLLNPDREEIFGYSFEIGAAQALDLRVTRTSGNLHIGVVVVDSGAQVLYQAGIGEAATSMQARMRLNAPGTYTIVIYRVTVRQPSAPQTTAYSLEFSLQPPG